MQENIKRNRVVVVGQPGDQDRITGTLVPGLHDMPNGADRKSVIVADGHTLVVDSRRVFTPEGLRYAEEFATLQGKTIYDIYIPDALKVK